MVKNTAGHTPTDAPKEPYGGRSGRGDAQVTRDVLCLAKARQLDLIQEAGTTSARRDRVCHDEVRVCLRCGSGVTGQKAAVAGPYK